MANDAPSLSQYIADLRYQAKMFAQLSTTFREQQWEECRRQLDRLDRMYQRDKVYIIEEDVL